LYTVTSCKIDPVRAAWFAAYSSALNEQGDPSSPTTIRNSPVACGRIDGGGVVSLTIALPSQSDDYFLSQRRLLQGINEQLHLNERG
jgi:hypothetical protein